MVNFEGFGKIISDKTKEELFDSSKRRKERWLKRSQERAIKNLESKGEWSQEDYDRAVRESESKGIQKRRNPSSHPWDN